MSRIIYGYSGEGSGHSSRTREMARHLIDTGHHVKLASYDRGYRNLSEEFDVLEIEGLTISSTENRVSKLQTIADNLKRIPEGGRRLRLLRDLFKDFQPDVVITDFEPMTAYLAEHFGVPLISLDNQHRMRYCQYQVPPGKENEAALTRRIIRVMIPWPSVSLITAFVDGRTTNNRSFIFPPIVRQEVQNQQPATAQHTLVYLTGGFDSLLGFFPRFKREQFFVYGYDRNDCDGNIQYFKPSQVQFVKHLATAKSVIATAGFTLISEALYLQKPMLVFPMAGQYEQELNAFQLQQNGFGCSANEASGESIGSFFYQLPEIRDRIAGCLRDDGSAIKAKLEEFVENDAAAAKDFKENRATLSR